MLKNKCWLLFVLGATLFAFCKWGKKDEDHVKMTQDKSDINDRWLDISCKFDAEDGRCSFDIENCVKDYFSSAFLSLIKIDTINIIENDSNSLLLLDVLVLFKGNKENNCTFFIDANRRKAKLLFLSHAHLSSERNFVILYGNTNGNLYKYFHILLYSNNDFHLAMRSDNMCENGIPIYNNDIDCISYKSGWLSQTSKDINHDGIVDFQFAGIVNCYCAELEKGYGREDREPIEMHNTIFSFLSEKTTKRLSWMLKSDLEENICTLLNCKN